MNKWCFHAAALAWLALAGCGGDDVTNNPQPPAAGSATQEVADGGRAEQPVRAEQPAAADARSTSQRDKIRIKGPDGERLFSVKWMDDGAKMVDADEQELARFNVKGDKIKIKDPQDNVVGYIVGGRPPFKIEDPTQQRELFKLQRQDDGDWKLEDPADQMLARIKRREYGYEVESSDDRSLYKSKLKDGKTSLRDAADKTVMYTKDHVSTLGFACLGLDLIDDRRLRCALLVRLMWH